jgi:hypothetical protein
MTPFAVFFMTVSMVSVTALAGYCMYRILVGGSSLQDDESSR